MLTTYEETIESNSKLSFLNNDIIIGIFENKKLSYLLIAFIVILLMYITYHCLFAKNYNKQYKYLLLKKTCNLKTMVIIQSIVMALLMTSMKNSCRSDTTFLILSVVVAVVILVNNFF